MKKYINVPFIIVIIIYAIYSKAVITHINPDLDVVGQIISPSVSQLNAGQSHFLVYSVMLMFAVSNMISQKSTLKIFRYKTKESFFIYEIIIPTLIQIIIFVAALFGFIIILTVIESVFSMDIIYKLLINFGLYLTFYAFIINLYYLFWNLNINTYAAILLNIVVLVYFNRGTNFISNSLYLLIGAISNQISLLVLTALIFWLAVNWILLLINLSLFNKRDVL